LQFTYEIILEINNIEDRREVQLWKRTWAFRSLTFKAQYLLYVPLGLTH
jgi:hypothetical protein